MTLIESDSDVIFVPDGLEYFNGEVRGGAEDGLSVIGLEWTDDGKSHVLILKDNIVRELLIALHERYRTRK